MNANTILNKSFKSVVLFPLIAGSCLFGLTLYAGGGEMNSIVAMNLNAIKDQADLILIGNLEVVDQPNEMIEKKILYESRIRGKKFYTIKAVEILKGNLPAQCLLVVDVNVLSSEGCPPSIELLPYMLFLKEVKLDDKAVPQNLVFYRLAGNWKGIISLDRTALECRAVNSIAKQYGININEKLEDFKEAIRYSLKEQGMKVPKKDLNSGAFAVYEGLKLTGAASQQTPNQTAVGVQGSEKTNDLNDVKP